MRCPIETRETADVLLAYCARRLDAEAAAALERHMASCAACREVYEGQRAVWKALEDWEAAPVTPDFDRRLYGRIEREASAPWWRAALPPGGLMRRVLPIAAAAGLLVMAGGLIDNGPSPDMARSETVRVDQVERTLEDLELLHAFTKEVRAEAPAASSL
jgi:anti-sigma factor RsiW